MRVTEAEIYAIDARMIEESGIGSYIRMMLRTGKYSVALGEKDKIREYDKRIDIIHFAEKIYSIREQVRYPYKELRKKGVTVLHSPHYNIPLFWSRKLVVTIHDLIHLKFPQYLPNRFAYLYAWFMMQTACIRSERIYTVSDFTKQDLIHTLRARGDKISITYNTVEECFGSRKKSEVKYLLEKYGISKENKVVLYVGNLKPHKNLAALIEAFSMIQMKNLNLVLVGKCFSRSEENGLLSKTERNCRVVMTGAVSKEELIDWYNLADVFVFPSLYEGFGVPPLEAMACGTPTVCSKAASIPEIVGDAAVMIDPAVIFSIQYGIEKVLNMSFEEKTDLIEKGYKRVKLFREKCETGKQDQLI